MIEISTVTGEPVLTLTHVEAEHLGAICLNDFYPSREEEATYEKLKAFLVEAANLPTFG